jgi:exodeoxyribonuclease V gamma subunit
MLPMRSVPFKTICLLGMNSDSYPRQSNASGFDLMAKHPRPGDRSRRHDDRYLFLEALISARIHLMISYTGRSIRDNAVIQPSVLVSELMDYCDSAFDFDGKTLREKRVVEHPLQPFSTRYFETGTDKSKPLLFSYSRDNFQAALNGQRPPSNNREFFSGELDVPGQEFCHVDIRDFCAFFKQPSRYLLEKRLGIYLETGAAVLDEEEPFDINGLDRYKLESRLVTDLMDNHDEKALYLLAKAAGSLPYGRVGENAFHAMATDARFIAQHIGPFIMGKAKDTRDIDLNIGGLRITGIIEEIYDGTLVQFRPADIKGKDWLDIWIKHLLLCASGSIQKGRISLISGFVRRSGKRIWTGYDCEAPDHPAVILERLVELYFKGLRRAIHFFPETSLAFYDAKDSESAHAKAADKWEGNEYLKLRGESHDPYNQICFRGKDPLDDEFSTFSEDIYGPLFDHTHELLTDETR